jgi:hypothetical protein
VHYIIDESLIPTFEALRRALRQCPIEQSGDRGSPTADVFSQQPEPSGACFQSEVNGHSLHTGSCTYISDVGVTSDIMTNAGNYCASGVLYPDTRQCDVCSGGDTSDDLDGLQTRQFDNTHHYGFAVECAIDGEGENSNGDGVASDVRPTVFQEQRVGLALRTGCFGLALDWLWVCLCWVDFALGWPLVCLGWAGLTVGWLWVGFGLVCVRLSLLFVVRSYHLALKLGPLPLEPAPLAGPSALEPGPLALEPGPFSTGAWTLSTGA